MSKFLRRFMPLGIAAVLTAAMAFGLFAASAHAGNARFHAGQDMTDSVVRTDKGPVRGSVHAYDREFLGIPYAAPPVGDLRWRPPQPHAPWQSVLDATKFGNSCPQGVNFDPGHQTPTLTEDCLFLNVYTPVSGDEPLPVLVEIHGGGYIAGEGGDVVPGEFAARANAVVVTINYRLGALGLLVSPALDQETTDHVSGNYGLMDQQFALAWVRQNIAAFGGDPDDVTIDGGSSGANEVCAHLASPTAKGLFRRAIMQSLTYQCTFLPQSVADDLGVGFANVLGCADPTSAAACMRQKSVADVLTAQAAIPFWVPVVGGATLPVQPPAAFASGQFNKVPVMMGSNLDDGRFDVFVRFDAQGHPLTAAEYPSVVAATFGAEAGNVLARYPLSNYAQPALALGAAETDRFYACPALKVEGMLAPAVPVYTYEFADEAAPLYVSIRDIPSSFPLGAYHGAENQYLFLFYGQPATFTSAQLELSDEMIRYWSRFIADGDPNVPWLPAMPRVKDTSGTVLSLKPGGNQVSGAYSTEHQCDFWNTQPDPLG